MQSRHSVKRSDLEREMENVKSDMVACFDNVLSMSLLESIFRLFKMSRLTNEHRMLRMRYDSIRQQLRDGDYDGV